MTWRDRAACRDVPDPRIFDDTVNPTPALTYCRRCPVATDCLTWITNEPSYGLSGSYTGIAGGQVITRGTNTEPNPAREWSDKHVRACHTAHNLGRRSDDITAGEREYQRRLAAAKRTRHRQAEAA